MKRQALLMSALLCMNGPAFAQQPQPVAALPAVAAAPVPMPAAPAKAAPDIQQQINTAVSEYQQKNYGKAAAILDATSGQLRSLKSEALAQFLPAAPKGWTTKEEPKEIHQLHIVGNGSAAERTYLSGGEEVEVTITTDNRLMAALRNMEGSTAQPMQFLGHDYIFKPGDPNMPEIIRKNEADLFVGDNLTIGVSGKQLTDQQAQGFMGLIDLAKLKIEADK